MKKGLLILAFIVTDILGYGQFDNVEIANSFFTAYEEADFEKMSTYWHDSLKLQDAVIGELYGIEDTHYGREKALKLWKQAFPVKPNYIDITVRDQFQSGNFVVTQLTYELSTKADGKNNVTSGDMITVFKFKEGKIIEHYDYGDYYSWDRQTRSQRNEKLIDRSQKENLLVAREYIQAYSDRRGEDMAKMYHPDVSFKDLTANDAFGSTDYEKEGKEDVFTFWNNLLKGSNSPYINVKINGMFYSGSYVMASTQFSMILPEAWTGGKSNVFVSLPIKIILQIKDGKILKHYDFADYDTYTNQISLQTK